MEVYVFTVPVPSDACDPVHLLLAAERATAAARALRDAGVGRVDRRGARRSGDPDERAVALAEPGVIFWQAWDDELRAWRRVPPGTAVEAALRTPRCRDRVTGRTGIP
jgi:hypothetical protein